MSKPVDTSSTEFRAALSAVRSNSLFSCVGERVIELEAEVAVLRSAKSESMTFDDARKLFTALHVRASQHLHELVASDPKVTNPEWRALKEARQGEVDAANFLFHLNAVEYDAKRAPSLLAEYDAERVGGSK